MKKYIHSKLGKARNKRASVSISGTGATMNFSYIEKQEAKIEVQYNEANNILATIDPTITSATSISNIKDANLITITNVSKQAACLAISYPDWLLGSDNADSSVGAVSVIQQLLKPGCSYVLPGLRAVCTSTVTNNAANGRVEYGFGGSGKDTTDERPMQLHPVLTQSSGGKLYGNTVANVDASNVITDEYGSFNYNLEDAPAANIRTGVGDGKTGLFNLGQHVTSTTTPLHYVPGSVAVRFYDKGYAKLGLNSVISTTKTGLSTATAYKLRIQTDSGSTNDILFTTDGRDVTFGNGLGNISVLGKINTAIRNAGPWKDQADNIIGTPQFVLYKGDVRMYTTTAKRLAYSGSANRSVIVFSAASGAGTDIESVGLFPSYATLNSNYNNPRLKELSRDGSIMFDDSYGRLYIGGKLLGDIDYQTGWVSFAGAPAWTSMEFTAIYESALGGSNYTDVLNTTSRVNTISEIRCCSVNPLQTSKIKLTAYTI